MSMHRCEPCGHNFDTDFNLECPVCGEPMDKEPHEFEENRFPINKDLEPIGVS